MSDENSRPIRPGAALSIPGEPKNCTANFVFSTFAGVLYLGTAAHCVRWNETDIQIPLVGDIGDVAFSSNSSTPGSDFALIGLTASLYALVSPETCVWGGPTAPYSFPSNPQDGPSEVLLLYGWGKVYKTSPVSRARTGVLPATGWDENALHFVAPIAVRDSGSPLLTARGEAIGIVGQTDMLGSPGGQDPGVVGEVGTGPSDATRLDYAIQLAEAGLGTDLHLVVSERFAPDGPDDVCATA